MDGLLGMVEKIHVFMENTIIMALEPAQVPECLGASQLDPSLVPRYNVDTIFARSNFPYDLGPEVDSIEFWSMRNRFEDSGYAERADTILYAGRDYWPEYPEDDWSPEFYDPVFSIITEYTTPFVNDIDTTTVGTNNLLVKDHGITVLSPMKNNLIISNEKNINSDASPFTF